MLAVGKAMKFGYIVCFIVLISGSIGAASLRAQAPGTPCQNCTVPVSRNGNDTLGVSYTASQCGLNFVQGSVPLLQRTAPLGWPSGQPQPAIISISGIPSCATVLQAFLYTDASGDGAPITATVTNPLGAATNFPMTLIGSAVDKCWSSQGFAGTFTYRADVTTAINGNGNYQISGLPVSANGPNDVDGATLLIVYTDPTATYTGTLVIADGADVFAVTTNPSCLLNGFNACAATNTATAFAIVSDLQSADDFTASFNAPANNVLYPAASQFWWDFISVPTTVAAGQTTALYRVDNVSDCYNFLAAGLYYQTSCTTCAIVNPGTQLDAGNDTSICTGGSAQLNVSGGSGYTWTPATGLNNPNIANPVASPLVTTTYIVSSSNCTLPDTITVFVNPSPTVTVNSDSVCPGAPVLLTAAGADSYVWSTGETINPITVSPLVPTTYTVTGTDASGCTASATAEVYTEFIVTASPDTTICPGGQARLLVSPNGAGYTASWTPAGSLDNASIFNPTATPGITTRYIATVTDGGFCTGTDTVTVFISTQLPVASFTISPSVVYDLHPLVELTNTSSGAATYTWDLGPCGITQAEDPTCLLPADTGIYCFTLSVASALGCVDTNTQCVVVHEAYTAYIPNSFTPNMDGSNELFQVKGQGIRQLEAHIYNRWGEEIFSFYSQQDGWNGKYSNGERCPLGVYAYRVDILDVNGIEHRYSGHINLLR